MCYHGDWCRNIILGFQSDWDRIHFVYPLVSGQVPWETESVMEIRRQGVY